MLAGRAEKGAAAHKVGLSLSYRFLVQRERSVNLFCRQLGVLRAQPLAPKRCGVCCCHCHSFAKYFRAGIRDRSPVKLGALGDIEQVMDHPSSRVVLLAAANADGSHNLFVKRVAISMSLLSVRDDGFLRKHFPTIGALLGCSALGNNMLDWCQTSSIMFVKSDLLTKENRVTGNILKPFAGVGGGTGQVLKCIRKGSF